MLCKSYKLMDDDIQLYKHGIRVKADICHAMLHMDRQGKRVEGDICLGVDVCDSAIVIIRRSVLLMTRAL